MKLNLMDRTSQKKGETKQIRRAGNVPAVIYAPGKEPEMCSVSGVEFGTVLREVKPGQLSTTVFTLAHGKKERKAILKEVQYEITNYKVSHLDFEELDDKTPVKVKVPVNVTGVADCAGIKLGGFLRQVARHVQVECLPKHIPTEFVIDVRDLGVMQSKRVSDLSIPKDARVLASPDDVVVVIAKK